MAQNHGMTAHRPATVPPPSPTDLDRGGYGWLASLAGSRESRDARIEQPAKLRALEARVAHDLSCLNFPPADWVPATPGPDGQPMLDVLVAGGGMCGQTAAFALRREGIAKLRVVDARAEGAEGPWATFARMEMLRSPKHLTGPDLGIPSLTFRAWYEARFGDAAWQALHKVWRLDWRDYLLWVRRQVGLAVQGETRLVAVQPAGTGLRLVLETAGAAAVGAMDGERPSPRRQVVHARHLVLALGREGAGQPRRPAFPSLDPASPAARLRVLHSMDPLDFASLAGRHIGVLGAAASAFDNAALALEHGAASVTMFARRSVLPQVNKFKGSSYPGFFRGYASLPDEEKVRLHAHMLDEQVPPPFESVLRCDRHDAFTLRLGEPWLDVAADADGVTVTTPGGTHRFDAAILATGFDVDLIERDELGPLAAHVLTWGDRMPEPPQSLQDSPSWPDIARFPCLDERFGLQPRPGAPADVAAALARIHLFSWGSTISHGSVSGDIPGLAIGAIRIAAGIATALFVEDSKRHHQHLVGYDEPELKPTRWWAGHARCEPSS
jgi:FAD-dependent urate hydroxylase